MTGSGLAAGGGSQDSILTPRSRERLTLQAEVDAGRLDPEGWIDMRQFPLEGVETPDPHTLRIRIRGKYPQFLNWLATTFVVPVPWEAERFYGQPGMARRELTLDMWPVGTGAFMMERNSPLREMRLARNPEYREDLYPCEGEPGDAEAGLLDDCGKRLPCPPCPAIAAMS